MWEQNNGNKEKKYKKIYFYSIKDTQPVIEMELSTGIIIWGLSSKMYLNKWWKWVFFNYFVISHFPKVWYSSTECMYGLQYMYNVTIFMVIESTPNFKWTTYIV